MKEYINKVPLSIKCPGTVDEKHYIIATVNLPRGTPVYNLPVKYKNFPVLVDYGTMRASTSHRCREYLMPGISISDDSDTLGALFTKVGQPEKKYFLTVNHGVGEVDDSIIKSSRKDNADIVILRERHYLIYLA
jgi:hypothetical protein